MPVCNFSGCFQLMFGFGPCHLVASLVAQMVVENLLSTMPEIRFDPCVRKIPWRRKWQPTPVFLPEEFCGQRGLVGYSPWGRKESDTTEQLPLTLSPSADAAERVSGTHPASWISCWKYWKYFFYFTDKITGFINSVCVCVCVCVWSLAVSFSNSITIQNIS